MFCIRGCGKTSTALYEYQEVPFLTLVTKDTCRASVFGHGTKTVHENDVKTMSNLSGTAIMSHFACHMSHCACHMSYDKCLCWFLGHAEQLLFWCLCSKVSICDYVTCHISHVTCHNAHVTCHMSNAYAYVDSWDMLNNFCFHVYAQKWVFVIMSHVACHMSHVTCDMSHVKCLGWSLGHAEQLLFSCLCSNVAVYGWKLQWFFGDLSSTLTRDWTNHRAGSQLKIRQNVLQYN